MQQGQLLYTELSLLIEQCQRQLVLQANSDLTMLFWKIGKRINEFILQHNRAEYGKQIVVTLSRQLTEKYGRNFEEKNLRRMLQFADRFADLEIVVTLSQHLSWSHFLVLIPLKKSDAQFFYAQKATTEIWGVRELRKQIELKAFERSNLAGLQLKQGKHSDTSVFKDPYFLDFLGLQQHYLEKDLETAILRELENFILELGKGFAFVERRKRIIVDGEDYYLDLLFYHRKIKRLIAVELKIGRFQAKDKGQMELYLNWLDRYDKQEGEQPPLGLILCTETSKEQIELLEMHKDGITVAEYRTGLPPKKELEKHLHIALMDARERMERKHLTAV